MYTKEFQINLLHNALYNEKLYKQITEASFDDFDFTICKFILSIYKYYYKIHKKVIPFQTLISEVEIRLNSPLEQEIVLIQEEVVQLAGILDKYSSNENIDTDYYLDKFPDYLKHGRVIKTFQDIDMSNPSNIDLQSLMSRFSDIEVATSPNKSDIINASENHFPVLDMQDISRVGVGSVRLNKMMHNGLPIGTIGIVVACPGVGKTNTLINFANGAVNEGHRSLFITLELSASRIIHRYQGMAAGIPASLFLKPMNEWPEDSLKRYSYLISPEFHGYGKFNVVDCSKRAIGINEIEKYIATWKDNTRQEFGPEEAYKCKAVYIDWINFIKTKSKKEVWIAIPETAYDLQKIANKYNVTIWTATQAKQEADGSETVKMRHAAFAFHVNDAVDVGIGVAPLSEHEDPTATECDRKLNYNINKNRDGQTGSIVLYQGPTLRLFDDQKDWLTWQTLAKRLEVEQLLNPGYNL